MDQLHFDHLTRAFGSGTERRHVIAGLFAAAAALCSWEARAAAKKNKKRCKRRKKRCGKRCVNLKRNEKHCGKCRRRCPSGERCCRGACFDTATDPNHCGGCKKSCPLGQSCVDGSCGLGPGTCQGAEDDACLPEGQVNCNSLQGCDCLTRFVQGDVVCGNIGLPCTQCDENADCVAAFEADAFCARKTGPQCCTNLALDDGFCAIPCETG